MRMLLSQIICAFLYVHVFLCVFFFRFFYYYWFHIINFNLFFYNSSIFHLCVLHFTRTIFSSHDIATSFALTLIQLGLGF